MASFNKVILMGNLTRDPEMRFTQNDMAICNLSLAVNRRFKDGQGEWKEEATFVDVTIFGKRGEAFAKHHSKGKPAFIEGSLRLDNWKDKESGANRSKLYVVGDNWEFVGGGSGGGGGGGGEYASSNASSNASSSAGGQGGGQNLEVDDTPF
jgi:single-strand DNA-binding protein